MKVLAIETSCDETSVAIVEGNKIHCNLVATQEAVHAPFGGVVPELASRRHIEILPILTKKTLQETHNTWENIDGIAATSSPGLLGALLVGLSFAKALAFARKLPFIGVNHLEGHLNSIFLNSTTAAYPFCALLVSGGHTSLYHAKAFGSYQWLGATRDDAAGEAYDKVAKLLGLGYPGGPILDRLATKGNPKAFSFKLPSFQNGEKFEFSFSGIKTAVRSLTLEQKNLSPAFQQDVAASFQETVTENLVARLVAAAKHCKTKTIAVAGGVAANSALRKKLQELETQGFQVHIPALSLCTDNAAMIGYVGGKYLEQGKTSPWDLNATATQELGL